MPITGISGGVARYLRRIKTGDYEHHEAEISFNVNVADGDSYVDVARGAAAEAVNQVNFMLGSEAPVPTARRGRPPGARNVAKDKDADPTAGAANPPVTSTTTATQADPSAVEDPTPAAVIQHQPTTAEQAVTTGPDPSSVADETLFGSTPAEVNDKDLMAAIMARNMDAVKTLGPLSAQGIRGLIGRYVANPGVDQARDIPQAKRGAFLKELASDLRQFVA